MKIFCHTTDGVFGNKRILLEYFNLITNNLIFITFNAIVKIDLQFVSYEKFPTFET